MSEMMQLCRVCGARYTANSVTICPPCARLVKGAQPPSLEERACKGCGNKLTDLRFPRCKTCHDKIVESLSPEQAERRAKHNICEGCEFRDIQISDLEEKLHDLRTKNELLESSDVGDLRAREAALLGLMAKAEKYLVVLLEDSDPNRDARVLIERAIASLREGK